MLHFAPIAHRVTFTLLLSAVLGGCFPPRPTEEPGARERPSALAASIAPPPPPVPAPVSPLPTEPCGTTDNGFDDWLQSVRHDAVLRGVSPDAVRMALDAIAYDADVIELDRAQRPLKMPFDKFVARRLTRRRVARGKRVERENRALLERISKRFGVPPEILVAIWGLETDYGENAGTTPAFSALATLAFDCRRPARFRDELMSALRILDRGDLTQDELYGAWAGELGQTQFLPSSYEKFGVDFDEDGRVDMVRSSADALASTARFLQASGWRTGGAYEVGEPNFEALRAWNASEMYCKTIVLFASKLAEP